MTIPDYSIAFHIYRLLAEGSEKTLQDSQAFRDCHHPQDRSRCFCIRPGSFFRIGI